MKTTDKEYREKMIKWYLESRRSNDSLPPSKSAISFWELLGLGIVLVLMFGKF